MISAGRGPRKRAGGPTETIGGGAGWTNPADPAGYYQTTSTAFVTFQELPGGFGQNASAGSR